MTPFTLRLHTVMAYAGPALPISALGLPLALVAYPVYSKDLDVTGDPTINQTVVGLIFTLVRLVDLVVDPLLGYLMDETRTPWGRRRPWVAGSVPLLLLGVYMLFNPPLDASWVYLAVWITLTYLAFSALTIAHMSWGAELSPHYHERSRIQGAREFALVLGMLLVLLLPVVLNLLGLQLDDLGQMAAMGWFVVILMPLLVGIAWVAVPEPPLRPREREDWSAAWRLIASNAALRRLLLADLCQGIAPGITATLYIYLIVQAFELPGQWGWLLLVYFVAGLVGVPAWIRLSYRFSKHRTLAFAMFYGSAVLPFMFFIPPGVAWIVAIGNFLYGLAYGAAAFLLRAILADVADQDTAVSGKDRAGLYYSLLVMTNKLGGALAPAIVGVLLDQIGFDPRPGMTNSAEAIELLVAMFVLLPMAFMLVTGLVMWNFPLDEEKQRTLREQIARRRLDQDLLVPAGGPGAAAAPAPSPAPSPAPPLAPGPGPLHNPAD